MKTGEQKARQAAAHRARYAADPEKYKALNHAYYMRNREALLASAKRWYEANPERVRQRRIEYRVTNREALLSRERAAYQRDRLVILEKQRVKRLEGGGIAERARIHGLTAEQYHVLLSAQGGLCAICRRHMERPYIDHDHGTSRVRGLLCMNCNTALGHLRDSPTLLRAAAAYLEDSTA